LTHVYNNYYRNNNYGVASTCDAQVLVEGNYFENVDDPTLVGYASSWDGYLEQRDNLFSDSGDPETNGTVSSPSYSYSLDSASIIPDIVPSGAGANGTTGDQDSGNDEDQDSGDDADQDSGDDEDPDAATATEPTSDTTKSVDLQAVVESGAVHLTWTLNNITPMGVEVYRDTDSDARGRGRIAWMRDGNALIDEDATPGTTYDYWIKATEADWTVTNSMAVPAAVGSYSD
jgi:hypothetical protein